MYIYTNIVSELEELRKEIAKIAKELEELKRRKEFLERVEPLHDPLGVESALRKALNGKEEGSMFVYAGVIKKKGVIIDSWNHNFHLEHVLKLSPKRVARLVSPLSNEQRVAILKAILCGVKNASGISEKTGLRGGELYHHLRELLRSNYIMTKERGIYELTMKGEIALIMISGIASWLEPMTETEVEEQLKELTSQKN